MVDSVDPDGRRTDRGGDRVAEDGSPGIAQLSIDELSGDDSVAVEGLSVG